MERMRDKVKAGAKGGLGAALVALGSNLGDSAAIIRQAMERLREFSDQPIVCSSLWESEPVDCPPGSPKFINAAVGLTPRAGETPETLLAKLQKLEAGFGRRPKRVHNEARPLDLDLIAFGKQTRSSSALTLPHPRARERRFVLEPLREVAGDFVLPGQGKTVRELLAQLPKDRSVRRVESGG
jgi:2-amino-4-hydroxy-6-hydroxymethyldihydropteridine diphosphokinase